MGYRGHVKNGMVVLDEPTALPEGTEVEIHPLLNNSKSPTSASDLMQFAGQARGLAPDASANVDHYLYGYPKQ